MLGKAPCLVSSSQESLSLRPEPPLPLRDEGHPLCCSYGQSFQDQVWNVGASWQSPHGDT